MMTVRVVERLERETARKTIENAHEAFGLNYMELASVLGVDRRTLIRYRKERSTPSPSVRERMDRLREISHLLDELFETSEAGRVWLYRAVPILGGHRQIDLMRRGELDDVLSVLAGLYSGAFI